MASKPLKNLMVRGRAIRAGKVLHPQLKDIFSAPGGRYGVRNRPLVEITRFLLAGFQVGSPPVQTRTYLINPGLASEVLLTNRRLGPTARI